MAIGVGAGMVVGVAVETVPGTYVAPTHFMLLKSESLKFTRSAIQRRPLRNIADVAGVLPNYFSVMGDLVVEVTEDILPQLLRTSRMTCVKAGAAPFTYTFTPNALALPAQTMSITVVRAGVVFGYTGCVIGSQKYSLEDGVLVGSFSIVGRNEAVQSAPTATYVTTVPFAYGNYDIQIPTATSVFDADTFEISIEDNAEPQNRLRLNSLAAEFVKYGERSVELTIERDFDGRADYDLFKALTAQTVTVLAQKSASASVKFLLPAAVKDDFDIGGGTGQAELIRSSIKYIGTYDSATSKAVEILVTTNASITIP
jgi:hypothetical protein